MSQEKFKNFIEVSKHYAESQGEAIFYRFLKFHEKNHYSMSYAELDYRARCVAAHLQNRKIKKGDIAILVYDPGVDYVCGFMGCLYAGVIAVPLYPPINKFLSN